MDKVIVPPEGPKACHIAFVGEAPGEVEERSGRPFVGPAGELLSRLMQTAGINRHNCYMTNLIKERPPNNDITKFISLDGKSIKITPEYTAYRKQLIEELQELDTNVIAPLGNYPLYAILGMQQVMKRRGGIYQWTAPNGKMFKVIPTIHPAAACREFLFQWFILHDLVRMNEEAASPNTVQAKHTYIIRPSYHETIGFLEGLKQSSIIAYDIEVSNLQVSCISFARQTGQDPEAYETISIPFTAGGKDYFDPEQETHIWRLIGGILENPQITKVGQNLVFDCQFLFSRYGIRVHPIEDTMIAQAILYPDFPKGLDFITSMFTKHQYYKDEGKTWFKFQDGEEAFWLYNAKDSAVCLEAFHHLKRELYNQKNLETYNSTLRLIQPLVYMQTRGIKVDVFQLRRASIAMETMITNLTHDLHAIAGKPLNPNSSQQLKKYFYDEKKYKPYINRKTGNITVDVRALQRLMQKGSKEAWLIMKIRGATKLKGTYLDMTFDKDDRMRCAYNPVGTMSGRLSSSKTIFGTGGNLQNQPPEMKKYFKADDGYVAYEVDLSQAENRTVAYIAPEPNMISAFESGTDIHKQTASLIYGIPISQVTKTQRQIGKKANHGLNYGMGFMLFALLCQTDEYNPIDITNAEARTIVEKYHMAYPGVRAYHGWIEAQLRQDRTLISCFGRRRLFLDRWGEQLFKNAYSYIPQNTVATIINMRGLIYVWDNKELFPGLELLNQVHDSMVIQISRDQPPEEHSRMLGLISASLSSPIQWKNLQFSIPCDWKMGLDLYNMVPLEKQGPEDIEAAYMKAKSLQKEAIDGETASGLA